MHRAATSGCLVIVVVNIIHCGFKLKGDNLILLSALIAVAPAYLFLGWDDDGIFEQWHAAASVEPIESK